MHRLREFDSCENTASINLCCYCHIITGLAFSYIILTTIIHQFGVSTISQISHLLIILSKTLDEDIFNFLHLQDGQANCPFYCICLDLPDWLISKSGYLGIKVSNDQYDFCLVRDLTKFEGRFSLVTVIIGVGAVPFLS
jgi:hypothetical protein